jgi:hypothetical protein
LKKHLVCLLLLSFCGPLPSAAMELGRILRFEGRVVHFPAGGVRGEPVTGILPLEINDMVTTRRQAQAWIGLGATDQIVLKEDSSLTVLGPERIGMDGGTVLFHIQQRSAVKGLQIATPTATIGVKGTRFAVVDNQGELLVFLKDGRLQIDAVAKEGLKDLRDAAETLQAAMKADFEASRGKMKADFERAKEAMRAGDFNSVMSFDMEAGMAISISGGELRWTPFPPWLETELEQFQDSDRL